MSLTLTTQTVSTKATTVERALTVASADRALQTVLATTAVATTATLAERRGTAPVGVETVCVETTNLTPAVSVDRKWSISHVPAKGMDFGLTKVYHQRPKSHPPG